MKIAPGSTAALSVESACAYAVIDIAYSGVKRMQIRTGPARYQGDIAVPLETRASPLGFRWMAQAATRQFLTSIIEPGSLHFHLVS
jgi:hypothetical protein